MVAPRRTARRVWRNSRRSIRRFTRRACP